MSKMRSLTKKTLNNHIFELGNKKNLNMKCNRFHSRLHQAEKIFSELEDRFFEIIQSEEKKENKEGRKKAWRKIQTSRY